MKKKKSFFVIPALLLIAVLAISAYTAEAPVERRKFDPRLNLAREYAFPDEHNVVPWNGEPTTANLGRATRKDPQGLGEFLGSTWFDYQRNGSMRRMVAIGHNGSPDTMLIHFSWMGLPGSTFVSRKDWYTAWNAASGQFDCIVGIQPDDEYAGYTTVAVTNDNRGIVTNHNNLNPPSGSYATHAYWDFGPGFCFFGTNCRIPDTLGSWCQAIPGDDPYIWPASAWQEGADTILHVIAVEKNGSEIPYPEDVHPKTLAYFHTHNPEDAAPNCVWELYCVDTVYDLAQDIDCTDDGKVIIGWIANRNNPALNCGGGDTCSCDANVCPDYINFVQWDNDVYWQISNDGGHTWLPRVNITKHTDSCETGMAETRPYRPYTDLSVLIDSKNDAHIVWASRSWGGDANCGGSTGLFRGRLFHYSEDNPSIRTVLTTEWGPIPGGGGGNANMYYDCFESIGRATVTLNPSDSLCFSGVDIDLSSVFQNATVVARNEGGKYSNSQTIWTEIVHLELIGFDPVIGNVVVRNRTEPLSLGQIDSVLVDGSGKLTSGLSSFDVFVEIELVDLGMTLNDLGITLNTGNTPLRIEVEIDSLPPLGFGYIPPPTDPPLKLFNILTTEWVGWLCHGEHQPTIEVQCDKSSLAGLVTPRSDRAIAGGQAGLFRGRLFHYSEDHPTVRTVHNAEWDQVTCSPGAWNLNASKPTVSECDGKLYVLFTQFNDIPAGVFDDCAHPTHPGYPFGAANGELYMAISADYGLTWAKSQNLTNTRISNALNEYCDKPGGTYGPCQSEHWASMPKFGTDYVSIFPNNTVEPDNCPNPGDFFLDVQYIEDNSAGGIVQNEGYWTESDVRWFRVPCCDPVVEPQINLSPNFIGYPCWTRHGVQKDVDVDVENNGNAVLNYTLSEEEDTGPGGWLSTTGFDGSIPSGTGNIETGTIHINTGGIVNSPGTIMYLSGRLIFTSNAPTTPDTLPIECWVTDTLIRPIWGTVRTTCLGLTVANNGNMGNQGKGGVNMDYIDAGDCDSTQATGGPADVYLYDGSPVIGYLDGGDTVCNWSIFNTTQVDDEGFVPIGLHMPTIDVGEYEAFKSGPFVTHDSDIVIEKTWFAPKAPFDSCSFVIERIRIYSNTDVPIDNVIIGEAIDWDVPADSGSDNGSGFDVTRKLLYQQGGEYNQDDTTECQDNDRRWGGIDFLGCYDTEGNKVKTDPYGAYTEDNATYVYPGGGFICGEQYARWDSAAGYSIYTSVHPDSQFVDLHSVMIFDHKITINPGDTLIYYVSLVTHMNGTLADFLAEVDEQIDWFKNHIEPVSACTTCCEFGGDVNHSGGTPNVADLTYLVDFLFRGGPPPPCGSEGDVNGGGGTANVADLTYLVDFLFRGGPPPPPYPCTQ